MIQIVRPGNNKKTIDPELSKETDEVVIHQSQFQHKSVICHDFILDAKNINLVLDLAAGQDLAFLVIYFTSVLL